MNIPRAFIVHCPALGRDLSHIRAHVPGVEVVETPLTPRRSHDGCIAGHQAAVRLAKAHGWSEVMVLEDDCIFTDAFSMDRWLSDLSWARSHGYTFLNGGCFSTRHPRLVREGLFAVERFKSSHCVIYLPEAYDLVERLVFPMDVMIGRLGARVVVTHPFVAIQGLSYSGIQRQPANYVAAYARHEAYLGSLMPAGVAA